MFRKTHDVNERSRARLKNSEAKKLRGALSEEFGVPTEEIDRVMPPKDGVVAVKLASRTIVYLHAPSETPLFFDKAGRKDLYPTVFVLWRLPTFLPPLITHCGVSPRILGGADLMLPGVIEAAHDRLGYPLTDLRRGQKRCVIALGNPMPLAVGEVLKGAEEVQITGLRGKGLQIHHVFGDQLYERGNREPPEGFEADRILPVLEILPEEEATDAGDEEGDGQFEDGDEDVDQFPSTTDASTAQEEGTEKVGLEADDEVEGGGEETKGTAAEDSADRPTETEEAETAEEVSAEEMDDLLWRSFLQALRKDLRNDSKMPLLANIFFANMVLPRRPLGSTLNVKKSSFRKFSSFLVAVEEEGLVEVEDGGPGQEFIVAVNRQHELYKSHRIHQDVKTGLASDDVEGDAEEGMWGDSGRRDYGARLRPIEVHKLFRLAGKSVKLLQALMSAAEGHDSQAGFPALQEAVNDTEVEDLEPTAEDVFMPEIESYYSDIGGGDYLSASGLRQLLGDYIRLQDSSDPTDPRMIVLDENLLSSLYLSSKKAPVEVGGRISKKQAVKLWQSRAQSFTALKTHENGPQVVVRGEEPPKVTILVEKLGKHYSSHIANLEVYNIDLQEFTRACSRRFAASASVSDTREGKPGMKKKEVLVQGNLTAEMPQFLQSEYGIPTRLVDVQQGKGMTKKKKKK